MVDVEELKAKFLNHEFDTKPFKIDMNQVAAAARAAGETLPAFTDPADPDFQVMPAFLASFASGRRLPIDFPALGGISMDGGKAVSSHQPVYPSKGFDTSTDPPRRMGSSVRAPALVCDEQSCTGSCRNGLLTSVSKSFLWR